MSYKLLACYSVICTASGDYKQLYLHTLSEYMLVYVDWKRLQAIGSLEIDIYIYKCMNRWQLYIMEKKRQKI